MEAHNERQKEQYKSNPDIDTAKAAANYHLIQPQHRYYAEIMRRVEAAKCRVRKDSVLMIEALITASPEFMSGRSSSEQREYFERALTFVRNEMGEENVFAATVHMDERNPHMHICMVPLTPDKRLSAKTIMGNQKKLSDWQTKFHEHMSARWNELERGASAMETHRKHIPVWLYKKAQRLDIQAEKIKQSLEDITMFNAGKKREEALKALEMWLPEAERFTAQVKGTQDYINQLVDTRSVLSQKLSEKQERYTELSMEAAYMRRSLKAQQRLLDKVPREVMDEIQRAKKSREIAR
jgi:hypothetical protein